MQPRDKFFNALFAIRSAAEPSDSEAVAVVAASDRLDADGVDTLRLKLTSCAQSGSWRYVVDLRRVKKMDSLGLGMLVSALRTIRDLGGAVGLVTASPKLQSILELCTHSRSCKIYARTGDALEALRNAARPNTAA